MLTTPLAFYLLTLWYVWRDFGSAGGLQDEDWCCALASDAVWRDVVQKITAAPATPLHFTIDAKLMTAVKRDFELPSFASQPNRTFFVVWQRMR